MNYLVHIKEEGGEEEEREEGEKVEVMWKSGKEKNKIQRTKQNKERVSTIIIKGNLQRRYKSNKHVCIKQ